MTKATAKYVRTSSRKVRRVINEIRGKHVTEAKTILKFMPYAASFVVAKVLNSAIANAKENENLSPDKLKISNAFVNDAPVLKRWRAVSRGRGFSILKRISSRFEFLNGYNKKPYFFNSSESRSKFGSSFLPKFPSMSVPTPTRASATRSVKTASAPAI